MPTGYTPRYDIALGTIVGAYQGTNCYDVISDAYGRHRCYWGGGFSGYPGVRNGGGLQPNSFCIFAFAPGQEEGFILTAVDAAWVQDPTAEPSQVITYPQVSGFRLNQGFVGQLYAGGLGNLQNYPSDVADDLVNGEQAIASPFGPGVGVELFRAWVRGGAMSGLYCFDTNLTRLVGLDFEFTTLAQQDYDRRQGSSLTRSRSRVFYPSEATSDLLPRVLEVAGALHGGLQTYVGASSARSLAKPRLALFHESIGTNGDYVMESAGGIHLVRSVTAVMPEESVAPAETSGIVGEQPLDTDIVREAVAAKPRAAVSTDETLSIPWFQHGIDLVQALINKSRGGFDRLPVQWPTDTFAPLPFFTAYNKDMWRSLPQAIEVTVDAVETTPRVFYLGRSSVSLNPDGSIVLEDAWHSQIVMAGGNIMLSAAHDIILSAGRNVVGIAGNVAALRAESSVDISANSGRVSIKAETDLAMLGGNGGVDGGVLIESKSIARQTTVGLGSAQAVGGVVIKSTSGVYLDGAEVGITATVTDVTIVAKSRLQFVAAEAIFKVTQVLIYTDPTLPQPAYYLTATQALVPGGLIVQGQLMAQNVFADGNINVTGSVAATGGSLQVSPNQLNAAVKPVRAALTAFENEVATVVASEDILITTALAAATVLNPKVEPLIGFTFPTSKQLGTNVPAAFVLPEMRWQTVARRANRGPIATWAENTVTSVAGDSTVTSPFPGYEAWTSPTGYRLHNADLCFDIATGVALPPVEGPIQIVDADYVSLNNHFAIGNDL